ncbi:unnamed protein product [Lupinus luteus]|uniref:Uncharacterized protein n=1 Tax=Lupinus luteus TaxID=3873 RepID=A0AAV1WNE2_LUPLU
MTLIYKELDTLKFGIFFNIRVGSARRSSLGNATKRVGGSSLESTLDNLWFGNQKLQVNLPRFDRVRVAKSGGSGSNPGNGGGSQNYLVNVRDGKSYVSEEGILGDGSDHLQIVMSKEFHPEEGFDLQYQIFGENLF